MPAENSTNVRTRIATPTWLRQGLCALEALTPELAAGLAERLFLRPPPRRKDTRREYAVLLSADRQRVAFEQDSLAVYSWGEGPSVLLVHGWGGSAAQMTRFVEPLVRAGFTAIAFDAPGHGASTGSWLAIPRFAAALAAVESAVGPLRAVIAHSLGGPATLLAIGQGGLQVERAALIGPPADALAWFETFSRSLGLSEPAARAARERIDARAGIALDQLNAQAFGPRVSAPLLVIHDQDDHEVSWHDGVAIAAAAPNGALVTTHGLGHRRILRDPEVIAHALAFISVRPAAKLAEIVALRDDVGDAGKGTDTLYRTSA
jgi:pimeloyl-ACP methyl ester carboxylesterase